MRHRNFRRAEVPFSQLDEPLDLSVLDGTTAREAGLVSPRYHQPSQRDLQVVDSANIRFLHPPVMPVPHHHL